LSSVLNLVILSEAKDLLGFRQPRCRIQKV
jgi:hypothetical protein